MGVQIKIILPAQIAEYREQIGSKARNLQVLQALGCNVPDFVAVPSSVCEKIINHAGDIDNIYLAEIAAETRSKLPAGPFAVRSCALIEDSNETSLAGQFHTAIDVQSGGLQNAIKEVVTQAHGFLKGDMKKFAIIIQKYIRAEFSGVVFTRDPNGEREMVVNYHKGIGDDLVSGRIKPTELRFYHNEKISVPDLPLFERNFKKFMELEESFKFPQDIEWCTANGKFYFLQSRPITTISHEQYRRNSYLDKILPKEHNFLFEKSEISEIAPAPSPFCFSLLRKIYDGNGPVANVYKRFGVAYKADDFLIRIGNELFIDRENEIKTLLPSFSCLAKKDYKMHLTGLGGIFTTFKNFIALNKIKLRPEEYIGLLKEKLSAPFMQDGPFPEILKSFLEDYELIFTINLLADKAIKSVTAAMTKEPVGIAELLAAKLPFENDEEDEMKISGIQHMKGNALEINDESPFVSSEKNRQNDKIINQWWTSLPDWKKTYFTQLLMPVFKFLKMRERGRWLTVKKISELRLALVKQTSALSFAGGNEIYFAEIDEIVNREINLETCRTRKEDYINNSHYEFPARLTGRYNAAGSQMKGISAGIAEGPLKTVNDLDLKGCILYTKLLTPDLTKHFGNISGMVSENGGMLSHLAIMAREQHIPVVAGFNLAKSGIKPGDEVKIDGNTGTVEKV